jgi:pyridoxine kinase
MRGQIAMILAAPDGAFVAEHPLVDGPSSGPGDLVSGLVTAGLLSGTASEALLRYAAAGTFEVIAVSAKAKADEMQLVAAQDRFVHPMAHVSVRRMVEATASAR